MSSKSTIQIIQTLSSGEYSDPFAVRALISKDGMRPDSFAERFWQMLHLAGQCPVTERFCTEGAQGMSAALPESWKGQWEEMNCAAEKVSEKPDAVGFLRGICINKPLCRPCRCKERVIGFLADTLGGDPKARNSAKRNVSNWLTDKQPLERETYIKLCYALGLRALGESGDVEKAKDANRFLSLCCAQNPLHLSDAEESIHYFCLRYPFGKELSAQEDYSGIDNYNYALSLIERIDAEGITADDSWMFTVEAGQMIDRLRTEEEILAYARACRSHDSDEYYTAKRVLLDFIEAYEDILLMDSEKDDDKKKKDQVKDANKSRRMLAGIPKEEARRVVAAFERLDCDISALGEISGYTERLGDVLYASGSLKEIADGERPMSRTVLLLCLLAQNCGAVFSQEQMDMVQTDDFTDVRSFNEFFRMLNAALEDCSMSTLNPRRRLDFLVLYSYFLFSRDAMMDGIPNAFSAYMAKAVERIMQ